MFRLGITTENWHNFTCHSSIVNAVWEYENYFWYKIANKHAPLRKKRVRQKNPSPWMTDEILTMMRERDQLKGTNGRQKTYEIFHVYCVFYSGFMCQTNVIFEITKDGSLVLTTLASWNCFTCRNIFQNGANDMLECLTCETAFCKKISKLCKVRIIRFWLNFASLW